MPTSSFHSCSTRTALNDLRDLVTVNGPAASVSPVVLLRAEEATVEL
jgi:hypothetical protein